MNKLIPVVVWAYLVVTVLAEATAGSSSAYVGPFVMLLALTQVSAVALFFMGLKYEARYVGLLVLVSTAVGLMLLGLFLWGLLGVPIPSLLGAV